MKYEVKKLVNVTVTEVHTTTLNANSIEHAQECVKTETDGMGFPLEWSVGEHEAGEPDSEVIEIHITNAE
jgi:hypothetical protein